MDETTHKASDINRLIVNWIGASAVLLIASLTACVVMHLEVAVAALAGPLGVALGALGTTLQGKSTEKPQSPSIGPLTTNAGGQTTITNTPPADPAQEGNTQ